MSGFQFFTLMLKENLDKYLLGINPDAPRIFLMKQNNLISRNLVTWDLKQKGMPTLNVCGVSPEREMLSVGTAMHQSTVPQVSQILFQQKLRSRHKSGLQEYAHQMAYLLASVSYYHTTKRTSQE